MNTTLSIRFLSTGYVQAIITQNENLLMAIFLFRSRILAINLTLGLQLAMDAISNL